MAPNQGQKEGNLVSIGLGPFWRGQLQFGTKNTIPEATGNTKAVIEVSKMMLHMILLQWFVIKRKVAMVEEIMGQVVANVPKNTTAINHQGSMPVVREDGMCEFIKRGGKDDEESRGHHQPVSIHRKIVVNTMKEKVQRKSNSIVGQPLLDVEETPM